MTLSPDGNATRDQLSTYLLHPDRPNRDVFFFLFFVIHNDFFLIEAGRFTELDNDFKK